MRLIAHPFDNFRLGDFLLQGLESNAIRFTGASAFARRSGIGYLAMAIHTFSQARPLQLTIGIDLGGTSKEALELLLASAGAAAELYVFHNPGASFHPKIFRFEYSNGWEVYAGSGNLTRGGLFGNYEAGWVAALAKGITADEAHSQRLDVEFSRWSDVGSGVVRPLTDSLIKELADRKLVLTEATIAVTRAAARAAAGQPKKKAPLFSAQSVPSAPAIPIASAAGSPAVGPGGPSSATAAGGGSAGSIGGGGGGGAAAPGTTTPKTFVITAQQTDVGHGQTTPGTQERAAEYFIPLAAVRHAPAFWGWPTLFTADSTWTGPVDKNGRGRMHRRKMPFFVEGHFEWVTMTYNPGKKDFRLQNQRLRNSGKVGDVLRISQAGTSLNPVYVAQFIGAASPNYGPELARCTIPVQKPSQKSYGYY